MNRTLLSICMLASFSLAACGGMSSEIPPSETGTSTGEAQPMMVEPTLEEQQLVASYETDVGSLESELDTSMTLSTGPDCDAAGDIRDRICGLADRICDIASRHPTWGDVEQKCEDSRTRCDSAQSRHSTTCE